MRPDVTIEDMDVNALRKAFREALIQLEHGKVRVAEQALDLKRQQEWARLELADREKRLDLVRREHEATKALLRLTREELQSRQAMETISPEDSQATIATISRDIRLLRIESEKARVSPERPLTSENPADTTQTGVTPSLATYASRLAQPTANATAFPPLPRQKTDTEKENEILHQLGIQLDDRTKASHEAIKGNANAITSDVTADCIFAMNITGDPSADIVKQRLRESTRTDLIFDVSKIGSANKEKERDSRNIRYQIFFHPDHRKRIVAVANAYFKWAIDPIYDPKLPPPTLRSDPSQIASAKARCVRRYFHLRMTASPETRNYIDKEMTAAKWGDIFHAPIMHVRTKKSGRPPLPKTSPATTETTEDAGEDITLSTATEAATLRALSRSPRPDKRAKRVRERSPTEGDSMLQTIAIANRTGTLVPIEKDDSEYEPPTTDDSDSDDMSTTTEPSAGESAPVSAGDTTATAPTTIDSV
jgi:hypothetical protein